VWAPSARSVLLQVEDGEGRPTMSRPLPREDDGWFAAHVPDVRAGCLYRYRLDGGEALPDPCSRYQPGGPQGPSMVVDPDAHAWRQHGVPTVGVQGQVLYEMHIGAFTAEGTFDAAIAQLPALSALGVTVLELMPFCEFPGRFNWGYDGAFPHAPSHRLGDPRALKRFVDAAHGLGLAVIADVVTTTWAWPVTSWPPLAPLTSATGTRANGERRLISTAPTTSRCANSSFPPPAGGYPNTAWTACASTARRPCTTLRPPTS
jgi:maltooligosyltrehalose trehalohydrolase